MTVITVFAVRVLIQIAYQHAPRFIAIVAVDMLFGLVLADKHRFFLIALVRVNVLVKIANEHILRLIAGIRMRMLFYAALKVRFHGNGGYYQPIYRAERYDNGQSRDRGFDTSFAHGAAYV